MSTDAHMFLDLRVRLPNDGSPLWRVLSTVPTSALRNERIRNLAYVGALVDSGRISVQKSAPLVPSPTIAQVKTAADVMDLRLRVLDDGGVLYQMLAVVPPGAGRIGRLKTLASIGALFELSPAIQTGELQQVQKSQTSAANADKFIKQEAKPARRRGARQ